MSRKGLTFKGSMEPSCQLLGDNHQRLRKEGRAGLGMCVLGEAVLTQVLPENAGLTQVLPLQMSASCRCVQVLLHYFVGANHLWLLVEGLYLHALLEPTVLPERRLWPRYLVVGWGE